MKKNRLKLDKLFFKAHNHKKQWCLFEVSFFQTWKPTSGLKNDIYET